MVIAAGKYSALIYVLRDGKLVAKEEVRKDKEAYPDRKGLFAKRSGGKKFVIGAVREDRQAEKTRKLFLKDLARHLKELSSSSPIEKVILFSSAESFQGVRRSVPISLRPKIYFEAKGNYHKRSVLDLLKKAKASIEANKKRAP